jgi:hypothetical protein
MSALQGFEESKQGGSPRGYSSTNVDEAYAKFVDEQNIGIKQLQSKNTPTRSPESHVTTEYKEPMLALAMDLQRKLAKIPLVFTNPVRVEDDKIENEAVATYFNELIESMSKNIRDWNSDFYNTDYSVRCFDELVIKMLDMEVSEVQSLSTWCRMNGPTGETLRCLNNLQNVDWGYVFGENKETTPGKLQIPTYEITPDNKISHVPFQVTTPMSYKYKVVTGAETPLSVLGTQEVEPVTEEKLEYNQCYRQLILPKNKYIAAFLKADEKKQEVIRQLIKQKNEELQGGIEKGASHKKGWKQRDVLKLFMYIFILASLGYVASITKEYYQHCSYHSGSGPPPACMIGYTGSDFRVYLPSEEQNLKTSTQLQIPGLYTPPGYKETANIYSINSLSVQASYGKAPSQDIVTMITKYLINLWTPQSNEEYELDFSNSQYIDIALEAIIELENSLPNLSVKRVQTNLNKLKRSIPKSNEVINKSKERLIGLQTQIYILKTNLNLHYEFLNTRFTQTIESISKIQDHILNVTEKFDDEIRDLQLDPAALAGEIDTESAVVVKTTTRPLSEGDKKERLEILIENYRVLMHDMALPIYSLDSKLMYFPKEVQTILSDKIQAIVEKLVRILKQMLGLKELLGPNNISYWNSFTGFLREAAYGPKKALYPSVQKMKKELDEIQRINLQVVEQNSESFELLAQVFDKMKTLQRNFANEPYSVDNETFLVVQTRVLGQYCKSMAMFLPSQIGITEDLLKTITPYSPNEMINWFQFNYNKKVQNINEMLLFSKPSHVASRVITGAFINLAEAAIELGRFNQKALGLTFANTTVAFSVFKLAEYYWYAFKKQSEYAQLVGDFAIIGTTPTFSLPVPYLCDYKFPYFGDLTLMPCFGDLTVSEGNIYEYKAPKVTVSVNNQTIEFPEWYITGTNYTELEIYQKMLLHIIKRYSNYEGPFS